MTGEDAYQLELHDQANEGSVFPILLSPEDLVKLEWCLRARSLKSNAIDVLEPEVLSLENEQTSEDKPEDEDKLEDVEEEAA